MTVTLCLSRSLMLLNRRPRAHSSGPKGPFCLMWLSLPHSVYNSVRSSTQLTPGRRTQLNYIIVRRPLDLWNRMFNCHQAEKTVMQFRGHSFSVHHSVVYHGNFSCSSHFISQFPPTPFPLITAIRMYHFLPVHHLEWQKFTFLHDEYWKIYIYLFL